jgi:hypothetical protein
MLSCAVPLALALSCSGNDEEEPPPPPGPVAMALWKLLPRGAHEWKPGDTEPVVIGCDARLGASAVIYDPTVNEAGAPPPDPDDPNPADAGKPKYVRGDWLFRPPAACSREQCGTLRVTVEPVAGGSVASAEASVDTVVVDLAPLADALEGRLRIRAELRENGTKTATKNGEPLADEIEVEVTREDCSTGGDAGAAGTPGSGGTSGSGGSGGTGGSSGSGNAGGQGGADTGGTGGSAAGSGGAPGGTAGEGGAGGR